MEGKLDGNDGANESGVCGFDIWCCGVMFTLYMSMFCELSMLDCGAVVWCDDMGKLSLAMVDPCMDTCEWWLGEKGFIMLEGVRGGAP